jgi:hypothetical protein
MESKTNIRSFEDFTASDEGYIPDEMLKTGRDLVIQATRIVNGYIEYLKRSAYGPAPKTQAATPNNQ